MLENIINLKTITELLGVNFFIPEYQRGYRWTHNNITQLLDDIWEYRNKGTADTFYCLQPVVVRKAKWTDDNGGIVSGYELIDGQQRLTSLHRIITYLQLEHLHGNLISQGYPANLYSVYYKTRLESKLFLDTDKYDSSMPDLYYMSEAYRTIKNWFEDGKKGIAFQLRNKMLELLLPGLVYNSTGEKQTLEWSVQVIWYEINEGLNNEHQKSEDLFKRLNRGRIPLTSAELIKARFVNAQSLKDLRTEEQIKRKTELIQIWDEIEVQLNDPKFWAFITNKKISTYSTKIELLFDSITRKNNHELDPLFSYISFFDDEETSETLWYKWLQVEEVFRALVYWYKNKNYYHKIGYLLTFNTSICELIKIKKENAKDKFDHKINLLIANMLPADWSDLSFDRVGHKDKIANVLLFHNLEIIRTNKNVEEYFPFLAYKGIKKSLEHIHAQNIDGIDSNKKEEWIAWLNEHVLLLTDIAESEFEVKKLINDVSVAIPKMTFQIFKVLSQKVLAFLPTDDEPHLQYLHKIENMALLGVEENIGLSNSVFEVKRRKILEMDRNGQFIPIATKRIFLKYHSSSSTNNYSIWTKEERKKYKEDISSVISPYFELLKENL